MWDAIVVGARCAGAPTAMLLARRGHSVLLLDRATFPSDAVSNGAFNSPGPFYLRRWGLLDRLVATGVPPVTTVSFAGNQTASRTADEAVYAPMRRVLDHLLVQAATQAGAELRERAAVTSLITDDDGAVEGVRARVGDSEVAERARIVIGADGKRSTVAKLAGAAELGRIPRTGGGVYAYYQDVPVNGYEFWAGPDGWAMLAPSNEGLTHVATEEGLTDNGTTGSPAERFEQILRAYSELYERVRAGRRRTRLVAHRSAPLVYRQAWGPGWALVGDAGYHQGSWNGYGMSHAFRDADRLAGAVHDWLSGAGSRTTALDGYRSDRDRWCKPFWDNIIAINNALAAGHPEQAPWNGERPTVEQWLNELRAQQRLTPG